MAPKPRALDALRQHIARLEGAGPELVTTNGEGRQRRAAKPWRLGVGAVDAALPPAGLAPDGLHDVVARTANDVAAATAFILAVLRRHPNFSKPETPPILWCQSGISIREGGRVFGHGGHAFRFSHGRIVFVTVQRAADALWVLEEAARSGAVLAAVGETPSASFKQTQRLSRAAAEGRTPLFCLRLPGAAANGATSSRWRVAAQAFVPTSSKGGSPQDAPSKDALSKEESAPRALFWNIALERCRRGRQGAWSLEFSHETHRFGLVAGVCNRPLQAAS